MRPETKLIYAAIGRIEREGWTYNGIVSISRALRPNEAHDFGPHLWPIWDFEHRTGRTQAEVIDLLERAAIRAELSDETV